MSNKQRKSNQGRPGRHSRLKRCAKLVENLLEKAYAKYARDPLTRLAVRQVIRGCSI